MSEDPKFTDGEQDLWPQCQTGLQRFDSLPDKEYSGQLIIIEDGRDNFLDLLAEYALKIGCTFSVTAPKNVKEVSGISNDIWGHYLDHNDILIPRYVLQERPEPGADSILFRQDIPAAHILVNLAHEIGHYERNKLKPKVYLEIFKGKTPEGESQKIIFTDRIRAEEAATDKHAFGILRKLGIPITPEVFVAQIPKNSSMPGYRKEVIYKLEVTKALESFF